MKSHRRVFGLLGVVVGLSAALTPRSACLQQQTSCFGFGRRNDGSSYSAVSRAKWELPSSKAGSEDVLEEGEKNEVELFKRDGFVFSRVQNDTKKEVGGEKISSDDDEVFADFLSGVDEEEEKDAIEISDNDDESGMLDLTVFPKIDLGEFRAASTNVSYFYLQNELGLSEETMWKITFEAGSILGMTTANIRRKVDVLRDNMNLSDDDLRTIIGRQPTILQLSADKNISPTILFLVRALDLGRDDLRLLLLASPTILSYKQTNLKSKINFFTRLMEFSVDECRDLLLAEPKLLRAGVRTGLVPRMRFLARNLDISMEKLRLVVQKNPRILLYSLDDNLIPKLIFYLIMTLGMDLKQVERTLLSYPYILDYNLDRHILPITKYFIQDLEVSPTEFRGILLKFPRLLTHSLSKIKHVVGYLRYELGLTGAQVKRVLYQAPQVIGLNTEGNLASKVEFLRAAFALNPDQLRSVVAGMPTLLVLSLDNNLQPKTDYLREAFGGNNKDADNHEALQEAILRLPTLLGYSLDKRIRPRLQAILDAGLDPSRITVGIPMTAEKFDGWLHRRKEKAKSLVPTRRKDKGRNPQSIVPAQLPPLPVPDFDPAGRIVEWTRPRSREFRKPSSKTSK
jgi:hypothetical protein